jgi:GT2 family glycosyltransferase
MAVPSWVYDEFRYDETQMLFDDVQLCWWYRRQGGTCGYVKRLEAWHYLTTKGQRADIPDYFVRKEAEFEAAKTVKGH